MSEPEVIAGIRAAVATEAALPSRIEQYKEILDAYDLATQRAEAAEAERDRLIAALRASPDEMTRKFCELIDTLRDEMGDKRELLHRLNVDEVTVRAQLLVSDQLLFAAEAERDALRKDAAIVAVLRDAPDEVTNAMSEHIYSYAVTTRQDMRCALTAALAAALAVQPTTEGL